MRYMKVRLGYTVVVSVVFVSVIVAVVFTILSPKAEWSFFLN